MLLRLFADPLRAELVSRLAEDELCICHLADDTGALPSAVATKVAAQFAGLAEAARLASRKPC